MSRKYLCVNKYNLWVTWLHIALVVVFLIKFVLALVINTTSGHSWVFVLCYSISPSQHPDFYLFFLLLCLKWELYYFLIFFLVWLQVESYLRIIGEPKLPSAFLQVHSVLSGHYFCHLFSACRHYSQNSSCLLS